MPALCFDRTRDRPMKV